MVHKSVIDKDIIGHVFETTKNVMMYAQLWEQHGLVQGDVITVIARTKLTPDFGRETLPAMHFKCLCARTNQCIDIHETFLESSTHYYLAVFKRLT